MSVVVPSRLVVPTPGGPQVVATHEAAGHVGTVVMLEEVPAVRTIRWANGSQNSLAYPYCVFLVWMSRTTFCDMAMYFRRAPVPSSSPWAATLEAPACWNLYQDRTICYGRTAADKKVFMNALSGTSVAENASLAVQQWWKSQHNHDLDSWVRKAESLDPRLSSIETWEHVTRERDAFVLEVDWRRNGTWVASHARKQLTF